MQYETVKTTSISISPFKLSFTISIFESSLPKMGTQSFLPEALSPLKLFLEHHSEEFVLCGLTALVAWVCVWIIRLTLRRFFLPPEVSEEPKADGEDEEKPVKPRFRKRDKVMFYGRKMLRKMGSVGASAADNFNINSRAQRQMLGEAFRRILRAESNKENRLLEKEVPSTMLEVDVTESDSPLPPDILYMLKSIKVFGHFERPLFLQLCKKMETIRLAAGQWLFRPGDPDDSIFVVQDGAMEIFIQKDGRDILAKAVEPGESVTSLLSILDVLTDHPEPFKTVSGRAVTDSTILRLPGKSYQPFPLKRKHNSFNNNISTNKSIDKTWSRGCGTQLHVALLLQLKFNKLGECLILNGLQTA